VRPYLEKNPSQKRAGGVAQSVGPEFKPQYQGEKKSHNFARADFKLKILLPPPPE
jgi:hypothetical protein